MLDSTDKLYMPSYEEEDTQKDRYLTFRIGEENYGVEIRHVLEIIGIQKITSIPEAPAFVKGVINLRGKVIPVLDVRLRFNMDFREYDERTCIIVVDIKNVIVGLIVDTINEVILIPGEDVSDPSSLGKHNKNRFIMGMGRIGDGVTILLDVDKLLHEEVLDFLAQNE